MELTTVETAALLGVTDAEVRRLLRGGLLDGRRVGAMWLVDASDVHRRQRLTATRGRTWTTHVAFAAVLILAGRSGSGLSDSELSRLRRALRKGDVHDVVRRSRQLITLEQWRVTAAGVSWLTSDADVFLTDRSAVDSIGGELVAEIGEGAERGVHVGFAASELTRVRTATRARDAKESANVYAHVVHTSLTDQLADTRVRAVVTALLLATHADARVRTAADRYLSDLLGAISTRVGR
jgi:excisionase family DNA binding protein